MSTEIFSAPVFMFCVLVINDIIYNYIYNSPFDDRRGPVEAQGKCAWYFPPHIYKIYISGCGGICICICIYEISRYKYTTRCLCIFCMQRHRPTRYLATHYTHTSYITQYTGQCHIHKAYDTRNTEPPANTCGLMFTATSTTQDSRLMRIVP
jgi:hypothetical protein